jgi:hypothetical protein
MGRDLTTSYDSSQSFISDTGSVMTPPDSDSFTLDPSKAPTETLEEKSIAPPRHIPCVRDESMKDEAEDTLDDFMTKAKIGMLRDPPLSAQVSAQGMNICELTWKLCVSTKCMYEGKPEKRSEIRKKLWGWFAEDFSQWGHYDKSEIERWLENEYPSEWADYLGHVCPP